MDLKTEPVCEEEFVIKKRKLKSKNKKSINAQNVEVVVMEEKQPIDYFINKMINED
jgi:hypothetical protein